MPSRGFYEIANREEGKVAQRDQSYRSCVLTLVIFFFLCIILILATLPWKRTHGYDEEDSNSVEAFHRYIQRTTQSTNTAETSKRYSTDSTVSSETTEAEATTSKATTTVINVTNWTDKSLITEIFESATSTAIATTELGSNDETLRSSIATTELVTNNKETSTPSIATTDIETDNEGTTSSVINDKETSTFSATTTESVTEDEDTSTSSSSTTESITNNEDSSTVEISTFFEKLSSTTTETTLSTTLANTITASSTGSEEEATVLTTTDGVQTTTDGVQTTTDGVQTTTDGVQTTTDGVQTTTDGVQTTADDVQTTTNGVRTTTPSGTLTVLPDHGKRQHEDKPNVCTQGECKVLASQMLFYMNHTVDPCEDFYEYACGGFEANPRVVEYDLESAAYNRILRQVQQENREGKSSLFSRYYNSCMNYETLTLEEKMDAAEKVLASVGTFYTTDNFNKDDVNFTKLVAELLLHNRCEDRTATTVEKYRTMYTFSCLFSALLFDVTPELEEHNRKHLTIKISPPRYKSPFEKTEDNPCYATRYERDQKTVNLRELYQEYETCIKRDNTKLLNSVRTALSALGAFKELNNASSISEYVEKTVNAIDTEIVHKFLENFPSKNRIREAYLLKEYHNVPIAELQTKWKIIDCLKLFALLTGSDKEKEIRTDVRVQVYFYDALTKGLEDLDRFGSEQPMELNNALLGLYAQAIYQQLIVPKRADPKDHCLRVAANLLVPEASSFYISTFSKDELLYMSDTIQGLFNQLKETLKAKINGSTWTSEGDRKILVAKIDNLTVVAPNISYFDHTNLLYGSTKADEMLLSDNYLNDSITLMKRYRERMYEQLYCEPGCPEQIWTYYTTPFQSKGLVIYELQLVVIPFGAIDWSVKYNETLLDYIKMATIGNTIAHQIARYFDANGIYYQSESQNDTPVFESRVANSSFEHYIDCHKNKLYEKPLSMTLLSTEQDVSYTIPQLTLNERLSETMGLRLTYDTLDRMRSHEEVHLPWLNLELDQLFYLTYAQMHCSKLPLTSSYVSLYEDEKLPSRISIFVSASNNRLLGEAWNCPDGSGINPSFSCDVFPYLQTNEDISEDELLS
ncbi:endothelin-converting enzyme 1 isoform X1 [Megalopta genalis]|uniref:endothelin-converting enzyme 1 isoform X1 n=1 Tax=Megalopta genalis TaxID=115081 RepID=UPI003FD42752